MAVTVASTSSSSSALMPSPPFSSVVPAPPVADREEPSLPWMVSLPAGTLLTVLIPTFNRKYSVGSSILVAPVPAAAGQLIFPSSSSVTSPLPETVTAFWVVSPASTFRFRRMTFRASAELLKIRYHVAGGGLSLFGDGGGGVGVPVGLSSAAFFPQPPASTAGLTTGLAASFWASGSYWPYSIT